MADLAISGAIAGLKTAGEMVGAFVKIRDQALIQTKVIELQSVILSAQSGAMAAQSEQLALLDEKRALETKIADLEAWGAQKERYELKQLGIGAFVYILKSGAGGAEPPHAICPRCYELGRKSILQTIGIARTTGMEHLHCLACSAEIKVKNPDTGGASATFGRDATSWKTV